MIEFFSASMGRWTEFLYHDLLSKRPGLPCASLSLFSLSVVKNKECNNGKGISYITSDLIDSWKKFKVGIGDLGRLRADQKLCLPLNLSAGGHTPRNDSNGFFRSKNASLCKVINAARLKDSFDFVDSSSSLSYNRSRDRKRPKRMELDSIKSDMQRFTVGDWLASLQEDCNTIYQVEKVDSNTRVKVKVFEQDSSRVIHSVNCPSRSVNTQGLMRIHTTQFGQVISNRGFVFSSAFSLDPCFTSLSQPSLSFSSFSISKARAFLRDEAVLPVNKPAEEWISIWKHEDWGRWMKHLTRNKVANKRLEHLLKIKHKRRFTSFQDGSPNAVCKMCDTGQKASHCHTFFTCPTVKKVWLKAVAKRYLPAPSAMWPQCFFTKASFAAPVASSEMVWSIWKVFLHLKHKSNLSDSHYVANNISATIWNIFLHLPREKDLPILKCPSTQTPRLNSDPDISGEVFDC
jgi:hypothetical protein